MKMFLMLITLAFAFHNTYSDEKFDQLSAEKKEKAMQAFNRSDISLVYEKLVHIRQKTLQELRHQADNLRQPQQRMPDTFIGSKDSISKGEGPPHHSIYEINEKSGLSDFFYQGDILLTVPQVEKLARDSAPERHKRQAFRDEYYPDTIWNNNTVYYYYDDTVTVAMMRVFRAAMRFWEQNTCIKFEKNRRTPNKIRVFKGYGCWSYLGQIGGQQDLSLGEGCELVGIATHELGHALGFFHTHARFDRDDYIEVFVENIKQEFVDQYDKQTNETNYNYGMPYDYGSIMQYGARSASSNEEPTMLAHDRLYTETMGSKIVGFYDISMMNEHYNCKAKCQSSGTECENGGFPNPNNCSVCICPGGYGGTLCNERPSKCGETLTAGPLYSQLISLVGDGTTKERLYFSSCTYWIQASTNKSIQVRLDSYEGYYADGCIFGGVEIKWQSDQLLTGYRFCSYYDNGRVLIRRSNLLPIIVFNRYNVSRITLSYRYIDENEIPTTEALTDVPTTVITSSSSVTDFSTTAEPVEQKTDLASKDVTTAPSDIKGAPLTEETIEQGINVASTDITTPPSNTGNLLTTLESTDQATYVVSADITTSHLILRTFQLHGMKFGVSPRLRKGRAHTLQETHPEVMDTTETPHLLYSLQSQTTTNYEDFKNYGLRIYPKKQK